MKILSFSHDARLYGAQRSLLGLLRGLQRLGHEVEVVCPGEGPLESEARRMGVACRTLPFPYPSSRPLRALRFLVAYPGAARRIRALVQAAAPDVLHFNTAACLAPAAALRRLPIPAVWHIRETVPFQSFVRRLIERWSDAVIFNCSHIASAYPRLAGRPSSRVVYNGLDIEQPDDKLVAAARRELGGEAPGSVVCVFAGQLREHKDPLSFVRATAIAHAAVPRLRGCLVGDGPLLDSARALAAELGLGGVVSILGFREDALACLAAADVVVCPSLVEPFPRVGLEAMALGKPLVATEVGGVGEQVIDGVTGLLVPPSSPPALAGALSRLATDPQLRRRLGEAAAARHAEHFSERAYAGGVERVLEGLVPNQG